MLQHTTRRVDTREIMTDVVSRVKDLLTKSNVVVPNHAKLEISHHYGLERVNEYGITMITVVNRAYCKKLIVVLPGQKHPTQYHKVKEETFNVLYGDLTLELDGVSQTCRPGAGVLVPRGVQHSFHSETGAVVEEISSTHSTDDSFYLDPAIGKNTQRKLSSTLARLMGTPIRVADYVFAFVAAQGVSTVFMVPGGGAMFLVDAVGTAQGIEFVPNHHEQASAIAAEAYARINGRLGVALVTTGPGATNAITAVAGAWIESVPMLMLSGQVKRADLKGDTGVRQRGPQEVDIVSLVTSITKYAVTVMEAADIRFHLEQAVSLATTGRRGPVWLDIPLDIQASMIDPDTLRPYQPEPVAKPCLSAEIDQVVDLINQAERPLILAGHGIRLAGAARRSASCTNACASRWRPPGTPWT